MPERNVTLMCYWNGKIIYGQNGVDYEGAVPKAVRVDFRITHSELLDKMYALTGFDRQRFAMKIICKYPTGYSIIAYPIDDDDSVHVMLDLARQPGVRCIELYLERVKISVPLAQDASLVPDIAAWDASLVPGPVDESVLTLQAEHRSSLIWSGGDTGVLKCRHFSRTFWTDWPLDQRIRPYVIQVGLYGVYRVQNIQLDWPLITSLVERWRQETHTFHLPVGEMTVTLQDTAILMGLRADGDPVTGRCDIDWPAICEELLGVTPTGGDAIHGSALRIPWLRAHFGQVPDQADVATLQRYARAYILALLGSALFVDKSGRDVHLMFLPLLRDFEAAGRLSWGSAALAHLYRELCRATGRDTRAISGPLTLLQLWAWERLHIGRPDRQPHTPEGSPQGDAAAELPPDPLGCRWTGRLTREHNPTGVLIYYRDQLDQQSDDQVIWQPYTSQILERMGDIVSEAEVWRTMAPLICFDIVEWHLPNRVLRQFGMHQEVPQDWDTEVGLHQIDRRGRHGYDWRDHHAQHLQLWMDRRETIVVAEPAPEPLQYQDPYLQWYRRITRRLITRPTERSPMRYQPTAPTKQLLVQSVTTVSQMCASVMRVSTMEGYRQAVHDIHNMCTSVLQQIHENRQLGASAVTRPAPPSGDQPPPQRGRGRGRGARVPVVVPQSLSSQPVVDPLPIQPLDPQPPPPQSQPIDNGEGSSATSSPSPPPLSPEDPAIMHEGSPAAPTVEGQGRGTGRGLSTSLPPPPLPSPPPQLVHEDLPPLSSPLQQSKGDLAHELTNVAPPLVRRGRGRPRRQPPAPSSQSSQEEGTVIPEAVADAPNDATRLSKKKRSSHIEVYVLD